MEDKINYRQICALLAILWALLFAWVAGMKAQNDTPKPVYADRCPYHIGETVTVPERLELDENGDTLFYFEEYSYVWTLDDSLQCAAQFRRDSLRWEDRDTLTGNIPNVRIIGDVISGYDFTVEPAWVGDPYIERIDTVTMYNGVPLQTPYIDTTFVKNNHPQAFRWYHTDPQGNKVRQIVVTTLRWPNLPEDLKRFEKWVYKYKAEKVTQTDPDTGLPYTYYVQTKVDSTLLSDLCGQRLAALTPKEYKEYRELGLIWGEVFEACYAAGTESLPVEERKKVIGMEIVCLRDSAQGHRIPSYGIEFRYNSREIMQYRDPQTGAEYLCAAPNRHNGTAEYTLEASDGRYETRWALMEEEESARWWQKYLDWIAQQPLVQRVVRWWKEI